MGSNMGDASVSASVQNGLDNSETRIKPSKTERGIGIVFISIGVVMTTLVVYSLYVTGAQFYNGQFENHPIASLVLFIVMVVLVGLASLSFIAVGILLVLRRLRAAHILSEISTLLLLGCALCELMLEGIKPLLLVFAVLAVVLIAMFTFMDPSLSEERKLQRKLRDMQVREEAMDGTLGRDETGRGYIALNFFNLFWLFVIGCFVGDVVETVYHYMIEVPGEFQIRAGLLWGPFSPIYGFGAVILTILLNRFYKAPVILVFLVSAVVGGAFEYFVSWFLEYAFGAVAWDYTGRFLNIGGRTDFMFMCMWGVLGVIWIKWLLPKVLSVVNMIPWQWRYTLTGICAALVIFDGVMTLLALDCWYSRLAGASSGDVAFMQFFADHFGDDYMANRFQSMTIYPDLTTRVS